MYISFQLYIIFSNGQYSLPVLPPLASLGWVELLGVLALFLNPEFPSGVEGWTTEAVSSSLIVATLGFPSDPEEGGGVECLAAAAGELGSEAVEAADKDSLKSGAGIERLGRLRASLDLTFCLRYTTKA